MILDFRLPIFDWGFGRRTVKKIVWIGSLSGNNSKSKSVVIAVEASKISAKLRVNSVKPSALRSSGLC